MRTIKKNLPLLGSFAALTVTLLYIASKLHTEIVPIPASFPAIAPPDEAALAVLKGPNLIRDAYQDEYLQPGVLAFFGALTGSEELAAHILDNAILFSIPPSLAFALCWEESRYNPRALNRANRDKTIDRGLFQLNSASFPKLREEDFYDPDINAYYGMSHLRWCLDLGGSEVAALAMYNAGTGRVHSGGTPKNTLDYVDRILGSRRQLEELFSEEYARLEALREVEEDPVPPPEVAGFRLALLAPLGWR